METETKTEAAESGESAFSVPEDKTPSGTERAAEPQAEGNPPKEEETGVSAESEKTETEMVSITDVEAVDFCKTVYGAIQYELAKVVVGRNQWIEEVAIALFTRGHVLLVGVPGLAKNLLLSSLAQILDLSYSRIHFTPDLQPSDVLGAAAGVEEEDGEKKRRFVPGPALANLVLADDINRAAPKTQTALLQLMQDQKISTETGMEEAPQPHLVMACQNPLEQSDLSPLPESHLDQFMFMIQLDYPGEDEELMLMKLGTGAPPEALRPVLNAAHIQAVQQSIRLLPVPEHVYKYAEKIVRGSRPQGKDALESAKKWLSFGAGPRASLALILAAKAHALIRGQVHVNCGNVAAVAPSVLRHRVAVNFNARGEKLSADDVIRKMIDQVPRTETIS